MKFDFILIPNIIMLRLGLYDGAHDKNVDEVISRLHKLITDNK